MKTGTVFLVGAGPGDPALLTGQGKTCLEQADVVVYDALACSSVLNLTRPDCELIFAGKTAGNHHKKQSETNQLLAELAQQGKRVVRLKAVTPLSLDAGEKKHRCCDRWESLFRSYPAFPPAIVCRLMPESL